MLLTADGLGTVEIMRRTGKSKTRAARERASTPSTSCWWAPRTFAGLPSVERRALLRKHLRRAGAAIIYSEHLEGADGEAMFRHACAMGLEGIVSKRATSCYMSGSCVSWVKVKNPAYERRRMAAYSSHHARARYSSAHGPLETKKLSLVTLTKKEYAVVFGSKMIAPPK